MEPLVVIGGDMPAVLYAGHDLNPDEAVDEMAAYLTAQGKDAWAVHAARQNANPAQAWWGGDDIGFCGVDHPEAVAVTVVHVPGGVT